MQKLEDGAPDFTLWQETSNLVRLYIPVISVHFITNAAITSTCDAILDEETLFGAFWRDFIKRIPKDQGQSNFHNHPKPKCTCLEESGIQILNLPKTYWFNDIYCGYIIWVSQKDIKDITQGYTGSWGTDFIEIWVIQMSIKLSTFGGYPAQFSPAYLLHLFNLNEGSRAPGLFSKHAHSLGLRET